MDILDELSRKADEGFRERQFQEGIRQFNVGQSNKGGGFDLSQFFNDEDTLGEFADLSGLEAFEEDEPKHKKDVKVDLKQTVKAGATGGQQVAPGQNSQWALAPLFSAIANFIKGPEQLKAKSSNELGF